MPPKFEIIFDKFDSHKMLTCGPGSSVGIATDYGLEVRD